MKKFGIINTVLFLMLVFKSTAFKTQDLIKYTIINTISIYFESGESNIKNSKVLLDQLNELKIDNDGRLKIIAFTDSTGNLAFNKQLGTQRILNTLKLINSSKFNNFQKDTINENENRNDKEYVDDNFRRVDIVILKSEKNYALSKKIDLGVEFYPGSTHLLKKSKASVDALSQVLLTDTLLEVELFGHVTGGPGYKLSYERALAIKTILLKNGIKLNRIKCKGMSNTEPLRHAKSPEKNIRVEVVLSYPTIKK